MKRIVWLMSLCLALASVSTFAVDERDGTDRGNGGDEYGKAFINLGLDLAESLAQHPLPGVDAKRLLEAVDSTYVNSQERLFLGDEEKDAINYPESHRILVSRTAWDRMESQPHRRAFLVLHEYLGIMGVDDTRYQISRLLDRAGVCERSTAVREMIEDRLQKSCYRIIQDDLRYIYHLSSVNGPSSELVARDFRGLPKLASIYLYNTPISRIAPDTFTNSPALIEIAIGDGLEKLDDCRFFQAVPNLKRLGFSGQHDDTPPLFLSEIAPGCFAQNPKLEFLQLTVDFAKMKNQNFLAGIEHTKMQYLGLVTKNLEAMDPTSLRPYFATSAQLNIVSEDAALPSQAWRQRFYSLFPSEKYRCMDGTASRKPTIWCEKL